MALGDAHRHTDFVVNQALSIGQRDRLDDDDLRVLLVAALCHDLGKPGCTTHDEDGRIRSHGHDVAGEAPTRALLARLGVEPGVTEAVVTLVVTHMAHTGLRSANGRRGVLKRLASRLGGVRAAQWARLLEADASGRHPLPPEAPGNQYVTDLEAIRVELIAALAREVPLITGRHLIEAGLLPEVPRERGVLLAALYRAQLEGSFTTVESGLMVARILLEGA